MHTKIAALGIWSPVKLHSEFKPPENRMGAARKEGRLTSKLNRVKVWNPE